MKVTHLTATGSTTSITVSDALFVAPKSHQVLAQALRVYLSNMRQGTSKVKTRSEINRTKKKWFRQKGTGNARHGARTPNIFVGGGVSHGPTGLQNWTLSLPQQYKHVAIKAALAMQAPQLVVADQLQELDGKTKTAQLLVAKVAQADERVLLIVAEASPAMVKSVNNLEMVRMTTANRVNALDIAQANKVIVTKAALEVLEKRVVKK